MIELNLEIFYEINGYFQCCNLINNMNIKNYKTSFTFIIVLISLTAAFV